jgi:hypothetical protein
MNVKTLSTDELISLRDKFKNAVNEHNNRSTALLAHETPNTRDAFNMMMNLEFEIFERAVGHKKPHTN